LLQIKGSASQNGNRSVDVRQGDIKFQMDAHLSAWLGIRAAGMLKNETTKWANIIFLNFSQFKITDNFLVCSKRPSICSMLSSSLLSEAHSHYKAKPANLITVRRGIENEPRDVAM
jgi:hypothetical protein